MHSRIKKSRYRRISTIASPASTWELNTCQEEAPGRIAMMVHVFYPSLVDELSIYLSHIPWEFDLLVSVTQAEHADIVKRAFTALPNVSQLDIQQVENRGRDIAPLLVTFNSKLRQYDFIGHLHTKKTPQTEWGDAWREHIYGHLLGSENLVRQVFYHFKAPELGMIYPVLFPFTPPWAMSWLSNSEIGRRLSEQLNIPFEEDALISFPAGSMFWAKRQALEPLLELKLDLKEFPEEAGQQDGTLHHALERLLGIVCRHQGFHTAIIDLSTQQLSSRDYLNIPIYHHEPPAQAIAGALPHFTQMSINLSDALVTLPFTQHDTLWQFFAIRYQQHAAFIGLNEASFLAKRRLASKMIAHAGGYKVLPLAEALLHQGVSSSQATALTHLEAAFTYRQWQFRDAVIQILPLAKQSLDNLVIVNDTLISNAQVVQYFKHSGTNCMDAVIEHGEAGTPLGSLKYWQTFLDHPALKDKGKLLHIGCHEQRDVHAPWQLDERITPLHILKPTTTLMQAFSAAGLNAQFNRNSWQDDLLLGLFSRRVQACVDKEPQRLADARFIDTYEDAGYMLIGPMLLQMLNVRLHTHARGDVLSLPVSYHHLAARFYGKLYASGHSLLGSPPELRCKPNSRLARWQMKWQYPRWQRRWFWDTFLEHGQVQDGAMAFLVDILSVLEDDWWRWRIRDETLEAVARAAYSGEFGVVSDLPPLPS